MIGHQGQVLALCLLSLRAQAASGSRAISRSTSLLHSNDLSLPLPLALASSLFFPLSLPLSLCRSDLDEPLCQFLLGSYIPTPGHSRPTPGPLQGPAGGRASTIGARTSGGTKGAQDWFKTPISLVAPSPPNNPNNPPQHVQRPLRRL
jgi:hypothetical protein